MDAVIRFSKKYGYASLEEVFFRYALLALFPNWFGVLALSGLLFGIFHYRFGWLSVIGCTIGGIFLGWLYLLIYYQPYNLLAVVIIHTLFAVVSKKYFGENKERRFYA
jgi:hypothetical protein